MNVTPQGMAVCKNHIPAVAANFVPQSCHMEKCIEKNGGKFTSIL